MSRQHYTLLALALAPLYSCHLLANTQADDIVISASLVDSKRVENGSAITVLDKQYLQENQSQSVAEILRDVAGVSVANSGGLGKKTSVFMRGAASNNTVVVIDGVRVSDHSSSNGGFDFAHLMADNIERIEILKGPQSALWGSDAMGGVINITTVKGRSGLHANANLEIGENNYNKQSFNINGATEKTHYSLFAANLSTDGISAKTGEYDDPDADGYKNQNITIKSGHQFNNIFSLDGVMRYTRAETEFDVNLFPKDSGINSDDNHTKTRQRLAKINGHVDLLDGQWKNRLSLAYSDSDSRNYEPQFYNGPYTKNSGDNKKAELQSDYFLNGQGDFSQRFTVVGETETSTYLAWGTSKEEQMHSSAVIAEYAIDWAKNIFLTTSLRRDFNSDFENTNTHKIALSAWASDGIRLHASQGKGVKNPTFSQLFGFYATPDLNSETSSSWDAGVEYNFESIDGYIDLTYFDADYDDAIRWEPSTYGFVNQNEKSNGLELSAFTRITTALRVNGQYTYMETSDGSAADNELLRRPKHSASLNLNYKFTSKFSSNVGAQFVGSRLDYGNVELASYTLVNLAVAYQVAEHVAVNARIENALDTDYEEITDYGTDPLTAYIGISFK